MLFFEPVGPDAQGFFGAAYAVHDVIRVVVSQCRTLAIAQEECDRLNEKQVEDRRLALVVNANRLIKDIGDA